MYKLTGTPTVIQRVADGAFIPVALGNADYQAYLDWVAAGNTIAPVDAQSFAQLKQAEIATWMAVREKMCGRLASIASRLFSSDLTSSQSCDAVASSLLGLFTDPAVVAATDIASYRTALKSRYMAAVSLATPAAMAEFGKYDK